MTFDDAFEALTGHAPFPWQQRLYHEWFAKGEIPSSSSLPTGLGKTSVIPIWLIALANAAKVPRRLVYVVNRRTVVDQTPAEVERIRNNIEAAGIADALRRICRLEDNEVPLAISTLRGQFADNRQWSADPSRPAVICGTVDMIGSRLLFSGYRLGFKSRPLHAGFLGQDVLLVHDEAHLEPAFQNLITGIEKEQDRERQRSGELPWPKLRVMQLTATTRKDNGQSTQAFSLTAHDQEHPVVQQRLEARKQLDLIPVNDDKQVANKIAKIAAGYNDANAAVLVYVRTLEAVGTIERELKKTGRSLVLLTGTIRGKERDDLVEKPEFKRFLKGAETGETVYLVCTSAGEVGIDISADHMVCDLSTFESMAQRLGRVNRFGDRDDTRIDVVHPASFGKIDKKTGELKAEEIDKRRQKTLNLLKTLPALGDDRYDASPSALGNLDVAARQAAFAPEPTILPATDILFDAWALTSIRQTMPGRPPVEPYLHGIAEWQPPETYVAWRQEVEVIADELLERFKPEDLLDDYPLKPHELLRDRSDRVFDQFQKLAVKHPDAPAWLINAGGEITPSSLGKLADPSATKAQAKKPLIERIENSTILLPPSVGGLSASGTLDGDPQLRETLKYDVADIPSSQIGPRIRIWSDDPDYESKTADMRRMQRIEIDGSEDEEESRRWEWFESIPLEGGRTAKKPVRLDTHVSDVVGHAKRIVAGLSLPQDIGSAIVVAASLHDCGKRRKRFQITLGNQNLDVPLAKSGRNGARLAELFRHEFASVLDAQTDEKFNQLDDEMKDLVLHLIATHHGRARPHFPSDEAFDSERPGTDAEALAIEAPRRFARLQRKYGRWGLAYLESLLRAADWSASAEPSAYVDASEVTP